MKINKKSLVGALMGLLGVVSIFAATPSYAYGHYYPHHYYPHHHGGGGNLAAGLIFGTVFGMMAGAAMSHDQGYSCQRVYYSRYCNYDAWGDRTCYVERHVRYVC